MPTCVTSRPTKKVKSLPSAALETHIGEAATVAEANVHLGNALNRMYNSWPTR